ncbi:hypothetical protein MTO96_004543 [Rhipicephalus appendiculatus]
MAHRSRVHRFRDHPIAGVNWRPTRIVDELPRSRVCGLGRMIPKRTVKLPCLHILCQSCHAVYCWNESNGCEYKGAMGDMLQHYEKECVFHTVECLRCGEAALHRELATHCVAGCSVRVSSPRSENTSSESKALTLEDVSNALDVKTLLREPNQVLPAIQSQVNELTDQAGNQESRLAEVADEVGTSLPGWSTRPRLPRLSCRNRLVGKIQRMEPARPRHLRSAPVLEGEGHRHLLRQYWRRAPHRRSVKDVDPVLYHGRHEPVGRTILGGVDERDRLRITGDGFEKHGSPGSPSANIVL